MKYTHCLFDLDGTLVNSSAGVTHAVQYALQKCGIEPPPSHELLKFIGPPLLDGFCKFYGFSIEESRRAIEFYREYYNTTGVYECAIYDGIPHLLHALNDAEIVCVVATSKPHYFANIIIDHFGLRPYFSFVAGAELDGSRDEKQAVIAYALEQLELRNPSKLLMIGDRHHDVTGAALHGIACAGALWGFGSAEELRSAGACQLYQTPTELCEDLLSMKS